MLSSGGIGRYAEDGNGVLEGFDSDSGVHELHDVVGSLRRLSLAELRDWDERGRWSFWVAWGERALKIAREAGVLYG